MNKGRAAWVASLFCLAIAAVLSILLLRSPLFHPGQLYDNNEAVIRENESHHSWKSNGVGSNGDFTVKRFSGIRTVGIFDVGEGEVLSYTWNVAVKRGKFKIVLIDNTNEKILETIREGSGEGEVFDRSLPPGEYRVKFVGDNATVDGGFTIVKS